MLANSIWLIWDKLSSPNLDLEYEKLKLVLKMDNSKFPLTSNRWL